MSGIHVFSSAALNYIPKVRMLFRSLRELHPEWRLHLALADEVCSDIDLANEPFDEIVPVRDLNIPYWRGWTYCHTIVELATAIKPFMLAKLLQRPDCAKVIYLDPDIVAFSRLDDIIEALDHSNIVLSPHQTTPERNLAAVIDNEICSLKHGIYNLGFIAVSSSEIGKEFAQWWGERVYHFCRDDIPNGLFTDQRWIDLAPAFFEGVAIMRNPRHNVATWNLTTRDFRQAPDGKYVVNGQPLGFYHFTGFDSGAHRVMAAKNGGGNDAVTRLIDWYASETTALSHDPLAKVPWAFGNYRDGEKITKESRIVYRERVDLQKAFPDPFDDEGYLRWWNSQGRTEYPEFFDPAQSQEAMTNFSKQLTPGFRGGINGLDWGKLTNLARVAISQPKAGMALGKHGWEILKNEGVSGVIRRIST